MPLAVCGWQPLARLGAAVVAQTWLAALTPRRLDLGVVAVALMLACFRAESEYARRRECADASPITTMVSIERLLRAGPSR